VTAPPPLPGARGSWHRVAGRIYGPRRGLNGFAWVPGERLAIGSLPSTAEILALPERGITDLVVCRATPQTVFSQDLWAARQVLGAGHVAHAAMWDNGRPKHPREFAAAAEFAARAVREDPEARVLVHCQQGRRRSVMVAYAALRLLGYSEDDAARAVLEARPMGRLVPAYRASVERWLEATGRGGTPPAPAPDPPSVP
jgi:predicted protein tyrosine phosphatase